MDSNDAKRFVEQFQAMRVSAIDIARELMDEKEAIRLATQFISQDPDYSHHIKFPASEIVFTPEIPGIEKNPTWVVHFSRVVPEGLMYVHPETVAVEIDLISGDMCFAALL